MGLFSARKDNADIHAQDGPQKHGEFVISAPESSGPVVVTITTRDGGRLRFECESTEAWDFNDPDDFIGLDTLDGKSHYVPMELVALITEEKKS